MPTIQDVAQACGVSPALVSLALRNTGRVSPKTRERILEAVREMGYRPSAVTKNQMGEMPLTLGVITRTPTEINLRVGYYAEVTHGMMREASRRGVNLTLFAETILHEEAHRAIRIYCDGRCDGLLLIGAHSQDPLQAALRERGVPFVCIGDGEGTEAEKGDDEVDLDNPSAIRDVFQHLWGLGHRRIAFLGLAQVARAALTRRDVYLDLCAERGMTPCVSEADPARGAEAFAESADRWLTEWEAAPEQTRPTAALCWNDGQAAEFLAAMARRGLEAPADLSVTGIDDDEAFPEARARLTTVRQPYAEIAATAVGRLLDRIAAPGRPAERTRLPGQLLIRATTAPPG